MLTFGARLRTTRRAAGLTRGQLAVRLGVCHGTVTTWERDGSLPRRDTGQRLLGALPDLGDVPRRNRPPAMEITTVYLRPDQVVELRRLSTRRAVQVAALIREGIDLVLEAGDGAKQG